jgi:hypothetical protein
VDLPEFEQRLRETINTIPPQVRPVLLAILTSDEERRATKIGSMHATGIMPSTVELLIDAEEEPALRAVLMGMLRGSD